MIRKLFLFTVVLILTYNYSLAQKISGTVVDSSGASIPGVTVQIKGTTKGTVTDFEGKFVIEVADSNSIIVFSYVGFKVMEVAVGNQTVLNVKLADNDEGLEEVVVTGYGLSKPTKKKNYATVRVYFATDRNLTRSNLPNEMFGKDRSNVTYGVCNVSIPRDHKLGELEKASIWKLQFRNDPEKHVTLLKVKVQSKDDFFIKLKKRINDSSEKSAFIFVHGYNVSFEDASRRTAQMSYDIGFNGAPVFYSWPSQATLLGYNIDQGNIEWSQRNLKAFLEDFLTTSDAQNIYLIAHSMGNRGLTRALASIITENPVMTSRIREIILAAPDIDADVFKQDIAPVLIKGNKPITLYTSSNDLALAASKEFSNYPRAGQAGSAMIIIPGIETIDASNVDSDFIGHSYFGDSSSILADIFNIIHNGQRPNERFGLRKVVREGQVFWAFTE